MVYCGAKWEQRNHVAEKGWKREGAGRGDGGLRGTKKKGGMKQTRSSLGANFFKFRGHIMPLGTRMCCISFVCFNAE